MRLLLALLAMQEVEIRTEAGFRRVHGTMRFDEEPAVGDTLDLEGDLGLNSWEPVVRIETAIRFAAHRFAASFGTFRAEGDDVLENAMRWNETLFGAGERVESVLDVHDLRLGWRTGSGFGDDIAGIGLTTGITLRYLRVHAEMSSAAQGTDDDNLSAFWPQAELSVLQVPFGVRMDVSVGGIRARDLEVLGASGSVGLAFTSRHISASLLWQEQTLSMLSTRDIQRNRMRWGWDGLVLEVAVRF